MCGRLGIREAFSQAYHPQANGRAEVAGQQLIVLLRKLHAEEEINWVEALPRALLYLPSRWYPLHPRAGMHRSTKLFRPNFGDRPTGCG